MNKKVILLIGLWGGLFYTARVGYAAINRDYGAEENQYLPVPETNIFQAISSGLGDIMGNAAMGLVNQNLVNNSQIKAFLAVIRKGEGTADYGGYSRLFGGGVFNDFGWHPNIIVKAGGYTSTAAGAYQFLKRTWDETARIMGLIDFSPLSQDIAAVGRLAYRGAIDDILSGKFESAIAKSAKEWASLPGSPYGQPTISMNTALNAFTNNGGQVA